MVRHEEKLHKRGTAVGVLDSGFLPPKKSQMLIKNQFERNTTKAFLCFYDDREIRIHHQRSMACRRRNLLRHESVGLLVKG